jgi:hypothetical protein
LRAAALKVVQATLLHQIAQRAIAGNGPPLSGKSERDGAPWQAQNILSDFGYADKPSATAIRK